MLRTSPKTRVRDQILTVSQTRVSGDATTHNLYLVSFIDRGLSSSPESVISCRAVAAVASFLSTTTVIIIVGEAIVVEDVAVGCCVTARLGSSTAPPSFDSSEGHCFSQCCSTNCRRGCLGVFVFLFWFEHLLGANQV